MDERLEASQVIRRTPTVVQWGLSSDILVIQDKQSAQLYSVMARRVECWRGRAGASRNHEGSKIKLLSFTKHTEFHNEISIIGVKSLFTEILYSPVAYHCLRSIDSNPWVVSDWEGATWDGRIPTMPVGVVFCARNLMWNWMIAG